MNEYSVTHILDLADEIGEHNVRSIISNFSCSLNPEVENFLRNNAWDFTKKRLSSTYLVFKPNKGKALLVGYFSLTHKFFQVDEAKLNAFSNT